MGDSGMGSLGIGTADQRKKGALAVDGLVSEAEAWISALIPMDRAHHSLFCQTTRSEIPNPES
jgi:hypothetical protein